MCEGSASIAVNCDGVEGACDEREVLPVGLLTRPRSDRGRSCEWVNVLVNMLVMGVVLIVEDMGVLLACNLLQSQDANTQIDVSENRVALDDSPSLDLPERRLETTHREAIPLMPRSSGSGWATREMGAAFAMAGASYLPWLSGTLEERPGEGYWLSFNQRLPISYELGDRLYGLLHRGRLVRDEEDAEGEVAEDAVEEEII